MSDPSVPQSLQIENELEALQGSFKMNFNKFAKPTYLVFFIIMLISLVGLEISHRVLQDRPKRINFDTLPPDRNLSGREALYFWIKQTKLDTAWICLGHEKISNLCEQVQRVEWGSENKGILFGSIRKNDEQFGVVFYDYKIPITVCGQQICLVESKMSIGEVFIPNKNDAQSKKNFLQKISDAVRSGSGSLSFRTDHGVLYQETWADGVWLLENTTVNFARYRPSICDASTGLVINYHC